MLKVHILIDSEVIAAPRTFSGAHKRQTRRQITQQSVHRPTSKSGMLSTK